MIKVTLLGKESKTIHSSRFFRLKSHTKDELNQIRFPLLASKLFKLDYLQRDFEETIDHNTNNYRKVMHTYFETYD